MTIHLNQLRAAILVLDAAEDAVAQAPAMFDGSIKSMMTVSDFLENRGDLSDHERDTLTAWFIGRHSDALRHRLQELAYTFDLKLWQPRPSLPPPKPQAVQQ